MHRILKANQYTKTMNKFIIAVETTSEQKIKYLEEVLKEIDLSAEIKSVKAESEVSEQPLTKEETKKGSLNRAKNALNKTPEANIGLGIEIGYSKKKEKYNMFCCASIIDRNGTKITAKSHEFPLPDFHNKKIISNQQLGDHVNNYAPEHN